MNETPSTILEQINEIQKKISSTYAQELIRARLRITELEQENKSLKARLEIESNDDKS